MGLREDDLRDASEWCGMVREISVRKLPPSFVWDRGAGVKGRGSRAGISEFGFIERKMGSDVLRCTRIYSDGYENRRAGEWVWEISGERQFAATLGGAREKKGVRKGA